jgi:chemotaxis protein MotB
MMAFFLLMWLLGSTAKGDLQGIAEHFQSPLKVAMQGGSGSGDSSSVIKGGGTDLTRTSGNVKKGDIEAEKKRMNLQALQAERQAQERQSLEGMKSKIEKLVEENPNLRQFKSQMLLDITSEGLRIQIVDEKNRAMFDAASADVKPYTRDILRAIGKALNGIPNHISLAGHTDATPYAGGDRGFGNWELSTARANASRRELIAGGLEDTKPMRVVGLASTVLFNKADPNSPMNRRISIVVLNKKTEDAILADGLKVDVGDEGEAQGAVQSAVGGTPHKH